MCVCSISSNVPKSFPRGIRIISTGSYPSLRRISTTAEALLQQPWKLTCDIKCHFLPAAIQARAATSVWSVTSAGGGPGFLPIQHLIGPTSLHKVPWPPSNKFPCWQPRSSRSESNAPARTHSISPPVPQPPRLPIAPIANHPPTHLTTISSLEGPALQVSILNAVSVIDTRIRKRKKERERYTYPSDTKSPKP